jgi:O-antigen/teichoic acid export membrane protein
MASELKQKTIKGLAWSSIQNFANHGIQFLLMLVMARLLGPKEYGIIGLTAVFIAISSTFVDSGFANALIRKKDCTNDDYSTVFIFNLFISVVCYFILFVIAPFAGEFYDETILCPVLRVLGLMLIFQAFCAVQNTILTKNIDFKKKTRITISKNIISGLVGLLCAFLGFGVWALVIQSLTASILFSIMLWSKTEWYPSMRFSRKSFNELFDYGSKLLVSSLINTIYGQIYPIVIGKYFSTTTLGNFSRARHWGSLGSKNLTGILQGVTFPVLAKVQDDDKRLESIYRRMIRTSSYIIFPIMIGMSAVAHPLTLVVIGEKWEFSAYLLQIICFSMMWYPVHALNLNLLQVKGRSDLFLKLEIIKKILGICILCISVPLGIVAMCYFNILSSLISLFINTYYTGKLINVGFFKQMRDVAPTLILSMVMWVIVMFAIHFIPNIYIQLPIGILIGATIYLAGSYFFKFPELKEVLVMYKEIKNRKK